MSDTVNRYSGNTGRVRRVAESPQQGARPAAGQKDPADAARRDSSGVPTALPAAPARRPAFSDKPTPPAPQRGAGGVFSQLASRLSSISPDTDDLLLALILYLLYRESGDEELLVMLGAFLLL